MNIKEARAYLDSLTTSGIKLGLENTQALCAYFDHPEHSGRTVHIAGTNGKGSTAAMVESILRFSGARVGLYTSPHLMDVRERFQINRQNIPESSLAKICTRIQAASEELGISPTYFEVGTLIGFLHFQEEECDWKVIEVGLGGRLDSTNVCEAEISVLTSISRDHTHILGEDLAGIAGEKAAIIKSGGMVIAQSGAEAVNAVIEKATGNCKCPLKRSERDFRTNITASTALEQKFDFEGLGWSLKALKLPFSGEFQIQNAALAIAACLEIQKAGLRNIPEEAIRTGLQNAHWPGRLEVVSEDPLWIMDCAHNPESVKKLAETVRKHWVWGQCLLIFGVLKDKDIAEMVGPLAELADKVLLVKPRTERAELPSNLFKLFKNKSKVVEIIDEIPYALDTARKFTGVGDLVLVTGSIHTVAEARQSIEEKGFH